MKERKIHYRPSYAKAWIQCGAVIKRNTTNTMMLDQVTCRVCMFSYLADQAPWARDFLNALRGDLVSAKRSNHGQAQLPAVVIPTATSEPMDGKEERLGRSLRTLLSLESGAQKAVGEFFPGAAAALGSVEPVMDDGGPAAEPIGIEPGKVAEQAGDAGQVRHKAPWDF